MDSAWYRSLSFHLVAGGDDELLPVVKTSDGAGMCTSVFVINGRDESTHAVSGAKKLSLAPTLKPWFVKYAVLPLGSNGQPEG